MLEFSAPAWLRLIGTAIGTLLVIYGLFTVPSDQRRYENYLVRWWIWIEENRESGLRWQTAFMQVIAGLMTAGFDKLFGPRLLSLEAAGGSIAISMSFGCLLYMVSPYGLVFAFLTGHTVLLFMVFAAFALVFGFVGLIRFIRPRVAQWQFPLSLLVTIVLFLTVFGILIRWDWNRESISSVFIRFSSSQLIVSQLIVMSIALVASLLTDIFFIIFTRWCLRQATRSFALGGVLLISANLVAALAASAVPIVLAERPGNAMGNLTTDVLWYTAMLNGFDTLVALAIALLAIVMLLHRLVWPPLSRLLQVVTDEHVLLKRWPLFFAGLGVLAVTWPALGFLIRYFGFRIN
jgi:hypothetical protein